MAIISKPSVIFKGVPATFTLFKTNLISNHVVAGTRFADFTIWKDVYIAYSSAEGNQKILVNFDSGDNFQSGTFSASERARDEFLVQTLIIVDLDGEVLKIDRSDLNTAHFDVQLTSNSESDEFVLLLEDGSNFLLDSGSYLVLE